MNPSLPLAHQRIADCLLHGRDHLNLAGLGLTDAELNAPFEHEGETMSFGQLTALRYLDLTENRLTELPAGVSGFSELVWLGLNFNQLTRVNGAEMLVKLQRLYLRGNRLDSLPKRQAMPTLLLELDLTSNDFTMPDAGLLSWLDSGGDTLFVGFAQNPGEFTLRAEDGIEKFREHVRQLLSAGELVQEGKLLLVGNGKMGKSTLLQALRGEPFRELKQTNGVETAALDLETAAGKVRLNCWDFSGQEDIRATHQIFFTEPALYLVVWNARDSLDADYFHEWLWLIRHRTAGKGRALIVATGTGSNHGQIKDAQRLRDEFGGPEGVLLEPCFVRVECNDVAPSRRIGMSELQSWLVERVQENDSFRQKVLPQWRRTQGELLKLWDPQNCTGTAFLPWAEFERLCLSKPCGLNADEIKTFAKHQHETGRILWIDRGEMAKNVILSPDWLTKALSYVIRAKIDESSMHESAGLLTEARIEELWRDPAPLVDKDGKPEPGMPAGMVPAFKAFLTEFDLAHPVRQADGVVRYFIPQHQRSQRPALWTQLEQDALQERVILSRGIELRGYDGKASLNRWLARAFFYRLMVRFHPWHVGRLDPAQSPNWESGFCVEEDGNRVRVLQDGSRLLIEGAGFKPDWLVSRLIEGANVLARDLEAAVSGTRIVPELRAACAKDCPRPLNQRCFVSEADLREHIRRERTEINCMAEGCFENLNLEQMIDGVKRTSGQHSESRDNLDITLPEMQSKLDELLGIVRQMEAQNQRSAEELAAARNALNGLVPAVHHAVRDAVLRMDDSDRAGPCLFVIEPVKPEFLKHRGEMFGKQFRLHLYCERLLRPVSYLQGTEKCGIFEFTMDRAWWKAARPYVKAVSKALAILTPAAGFLIDPAQIKNASALAEQTDKLLTLEDHEPETSAVIAKGTDIWFQVPQEARSQSLTWLHAFLRGKDGCNMEDLSKAEHLLGLRRIHDKTSDRFMWVHPSAT